MSELNHICGPASAATKASRSAYRSHQNQRYRHGMLSPPCELALAERAWAVAEQKAGRELIDFLDGYRPTGRKPECGEVADVVAPGRTGYDWHRNADKTLPCPKCKAEYSWAMAEHAAGRELPNWLETYQPRALPPRLPVLNDPE